MIGAIEKECLNCKKVFLVSKNRIANGRGKFCSKSCKCAWFKGKHISPKTEFKKGTKVLFSKIHRERISESKKGNIITTETKLKISKSKKGNSPAWNKGIKIKQISGNKHWNWKGGVTLERVKERNSIKYKDWRKTVFGRDNYTCVLCGQKGGYLEADHILPRWKHKEFFYNIDNGQTLCKSCHLKKTKLDMKEYRLTKKYDW